MFLVFLACQAFDEMSIIAILVALSLYFVLFFCGLRYMLFAFHLFLFPMDVTSRSADRLRQLSVVGDLLVRNAGDQRKQIWYQHEMRAIILEHEVATSTCEFLGKMPFTFQTFYLRVLLILHAGDSIELFTKTASDPLNDYDRHAELEWITTQLRLALFPSLTHSKDERIAHAIQVNAAPKDESRYTE